MRICNLFLFWIGVLMVLMPTAYCYAVTAEELKTLIDQKTPLTIIDARSMPLFSQGHITGAIHIPGKALRTKRMPPVGKVIVYGDALEAELLNEAVIALNRQEGIEAELLEGGYLAWDSLNTHKSPRMGFIKETTPSITFQALKKADQQSDPAITIVDLRQIVRHETGSKPAAVHADDTELSDLASIFHSLPVITPNIKIVSKSKSGRNETISGLSSIPSPAGGHVYVLIDVGDGTSQKIARRLKAMGIDQTAILIGGEKIIRNNGIPGEKKETTRF